MASNDRYINIGMGLDIADLRTGLNDAKREMALADSEFKKNVAGLDKWDKSVEGLTEKVVLMATEMEQKKSIVDAYRKELQRVVDAYGEESKQAKDAQKKLNDAEASYTNAVAYTEKLRKKIEDLGDEDVLSAQDSDKLKEAVDRLTKRVEAQEDAVEKTRKKLADAKAQYGENSTEAEKWQKKLETQETQLGDLKSALEKYERALDNVGDSTSEADSRTDKLHKAFGTLKDKAKEAASSGLDKLKDGFKNLAMNGIQSAIGAVKDFVKGIVQVGSDFTATMSKVKATSKASAEEMKVLEDTAREYGRTTTFSATEAAEALNYMALAGWKADQSSKALGGVLDLAAASGMDLAEASDMVTDYMSAFGIEAEKSGHFADALAFAQSNANTSAAQLGDAYKNSAAKMHGAGQEMETVTAMLMAMANQGTKGSEAGTDLAAVLRDITNKAKDGAIAIGSASVSVKDARGDYRNFIDILADVEKSIGGLGKMEAQTALSTTFTSNSLTALNELFAEGTEKVRAYEKGLRGSDGTAKGMADTMNDNLAGDMKSLDSAIEDVQLRLFDLLEGPMRTIVQFITDLIPQLIKWGEDIYNFFNGVYNDLKPLWDFIGKIAEAIGGIVNAVGKAVGDVSKVIGDSSEDLGTVSKAAVGAVEKPWESLPGFVGDMWGASKNTFDKSDQEFKTIGSSIVDGLTSGDVWGGVGGFFGDVWNEIKGKFDKVGSDFQKVGEMGYNALTGAWDTVSTWAGGVWESLKGAFKDPMQAFKDLGGAMWKGLTSAWESVTSFFSGIWNSIKAPFDKVGEWFGSTFGGAWSAITGAFSTVSTIFAGIWNSIKAPFDKVSEWFGNTFGGAFKSIQDAFSGVKKFFEGIYNSIVGVFRPILEFFGIKVGGQSDPNAALKSQLEQAQADLKTASDAYASAQDSWWTARQTFGHGSAQERAAYDRYNTAYQTYKAAEGKVTGLQSQLAQAEQKAASQGAGGIKKSIEGAFSGVGDIITKPFTDAWNSIKGIFSGVGDWFSKNVVKPVGDALGGIVGAAGEVVGGVADGIAKGAGGVVDGIVSFGNDVVNGFTSFFRINSPSRLMRDKVGLMIGEGVAEGIRDSARAVSRASDELSGSVGLGGGRGRIGGATVVYNQTINSPSPLTAGQIYRDTRSLIGRREWE